MLHVSGLQVATGAQHREASARAGGDENLTTSLIVSLFMTPEFETIGQQTSERRTGTTYRLSVDLNFDQKKAAVSNGTTVCDELLSLLNSPAHRQAPDSTTVRSEVDDPQSRPRSASVPPRTQFRGITQ